MDITATLYKAVTPDLDPVYGTQYRQLFIGMPEGTGSRDYSFRIFEGQWPKIPNAPRNEIARESYDSLSDAKKRFAEKATEYAKEGFIHFFEPDFDLETRENWKYSNLSDRR